MPTVPGKFINREGRNEFQLFVAIMCIITGAGQLLTGVVAPTIAQFPAIVEYGWAAGLLLGGLCVLGSAFARNLEHNKLPVVSEFAGLFLLFGMFMAYSVTGIATVTGSGLFVGPVVGVLGLACLSRAIRVFRWYTKPREKKLEDEIRLQLMKGIEKQAKELAKGRLYTDGVPIVLPLEEPSKQEK